MPQSEGKNLSNQFHEADHLGGCMKGGDPATYYPNMWDFFIGYTGVQSVLDIGCGEGHALEYFKNKLRIAGLEGCITAIDASNVKASIVHHDFTVDRYESGKFDMVWC